MIRSESEYRDAVSRSARAAEQLAQHSRELSDKGMSPCEIENNVALMESLQEDLQDDIKRYERYREGDLSGLKSLREIGDLLIAARIARGLSQRDLAERLGIHESQVSRDERNEYQGISCERAAQVLEALSVDLELGAKLKPCGNGISAESLADCRIVDFEMPAPKSPLQRGGGDQEVEGRGTHRAPASPHRAGREPGHDRGA
jgi:transcriptional regulator with XRE-family HTH domain